MAWLALACAGKALEQSSGSSSGATSSAGAFAATGGSDAHGGSSGTGVGGDSVGSAGTRGGGASAGTGFGGMTSQSGGSSDGGAGGACSQYDDEAGATIQVRLVNGTSQPIYLGSRTPGCASGAELTVSFTGGADLVPPGHCTPTCEDMRLGKAALCLPVVCPINAATTLQPGESMLLQWSATYMQGVTLPAECPLPNDGNQCERVAGVKSGGRFTFSSQAGTAIDCTQTGAVTCPQCTPNGSNGCYTAGAVVSGTVLSAHADVVLDSSYGVDGSGGASGGTARAVEVTFMN